MRGSGNGQPVGEEDKTDSPGPLDREMRGRRPTRRREPKGKTYFRKYAIDTWASWGGKVEFGP
jgi:hypothetical protein